MMEWVRGNLPGPSPHEDPEQGHNLPSPIDQPALNVKPHSSHHSARSPPLAPSLAHDLLSGDTTVLMTRIGSCSMGLLGLGRWKLWISNRKVTSDNNYSFCILSTLLTSSSLWDCSDREVVQSLYLFQMILWLFYISSCFYGAGVI